jgi:hypothetical protein
MADVGTGAEHTRARREAPQFGCEFVHRPAKREQSAQKIPVSSQGARVTERRNVYPARCARCRPAFRIAIYSVENSSRETMKKSLQHSSRQSEQKMVFQQRAFHQFASAFGFEHERALAEGRRQLWHRSGDRYLGGAGHRPHPRQWRRSRQWRGAGQRRRAGGRRRVGRKRALPGTRTARLRGARDGSQRGPLNLRERSAEQDQDQDTGGLHP